MLCKRDEMIANPYDVYYVLICERAGLGDYWCRRKLRAMQLLVLAAMIRFLYAEGLKVISWRGETTPVMIARQYQSSSDSCSATDPFSHGLKAH